MGMFSFDANKGETPDTLTRKRKIAEMMLAQGVDSSPVAHPLQGVARIAQALSGNWANSRIDKAETEGRKSASDSFSKIMASLMPAQGQTAPTASAAPVNTAAPGQIETTNLMPPKPQANGGTFGKMLQIESGMNPNAVSPKGATGLAQIMPDTARQPGFGLPNIFDFAKSKGVQVADNSDATLQALLRNPQVNAGFGESYFNAMKKRHGGDERLAAASYNAGPGAVDAAGGVPNFKETQDYVNKLGLNGQQPQIQPAGMEVQPQQPPMQQQPMQTAQAGPDMQQIMSVLTDQWATPEQKAVAQMILQQQMQSQDPMNKIKMQESLLGMDKTRAEIEALKTPKPKDSPADVQEYQFYLDQEKAAGRQPVDFWTFQKGKVPNTTVNVGGSPGDDELRKKLQGKEGEAWSGYMDAATISSGTAQDMEVLDELITLAPQGPITGRLAEAFPGVSSAGDVFQSIIKRVAPTLRAPGSGSTSDIEYDGMLKSLPALRNKPEANAMISQIMKAKSAINIERGQIVSAYSSGQITAAQAREKMAELNQRSIMTPEMKKVLLGLNPTGEGVQGNGEWSIEEVQ